MWNTNSYFWEEKSVAKWSEERMKEILGSFKYKFGGGELSVTEVKELKGESSVSIRKGKKIVSYDYNAKLKWDCSLKDGEGNEVGKMKGEYVMPEISNEIVDDGDEIEVKSLINEDQANLAGRYENIWKKEATKALRKEILDKFVQELKQK